MGPCHHGLACPQVVDGGTASNMVGGCEYIDQAVAVSRQGVVLQLKDWLVARNSPEKTSCYEI